MASRVTDNKQLKCHRCEIANYTIYTCSNCNSKNIFNNGIPQNSNGGKQVKFQKCVKKIKKTGKSFAQVSQGKRTKGPKKNKPMVWDLCK